VRELAVVQAGRGSKGPSCAALPFRDRQLARACANGELLLHDSGEGERNES